MRTLYAYRTSLRRAVRTAYRGTTDVRGDNQRTVAPQVESVRQNEEEEASMRAPRHSLYPF